MTTPPPAAAPAQSKGAKLESVLTDKKTLAAGGGLVVVLLALYAKHRAASNGSATTTTSQDFYDGQTVDAIDGLQQQLDNLQQRVSTGTPVPTTPPPTSSPTGSPVASSPLPPPLKPKPKPFPVHPGPVRPTLPTKTVTVQSGQTLSGIAKANGISMAQLKALNPVYWTNPKYRNGNRIWRGDKVKV